MDKKKLWKFCIFVPFALAIGSFFIYLRYYFELKSKAGTKVTDVLEVSLVRYRNIGIFCLAIGVFLLFIKTLIDYLKIDNNTVVKEEKVGVLDRIASKKTETKTKTKYTFSENKIISDLLTGKTLKGIFINNKKIEKNIQFKSYDSKKSIIEFYDLDEEKEEKTVVTPIVTPVVKERIAEPIKKEVVVINNEPEYDSRLFKKCRKCNKIIAKDAVMCVHCGTVLKEEKVKEKKESTFNPVRFALNMIVILLCIILILLVINKINNRVETNKNNMNISYIEKSIN